MISDLRTGIQGIDNQPRHMEGTKGTSSEIQRPLALLTGEAKNSWAPLGGNLIPVKLLLLEPQTSSQHLKQTCSCWTQVLHVKEKGFSLPAKSLNYV